MDNNNNLAKTCIVYAGAIVSGVTLSDVVMIATLIYTFLQIYLLIKRLRGEIK